MATSGFTIRIEEYVPLADIILSNYNRDFVAITARYPKLNDAFKTAFKTKLEAIKAQEKSIVIKEQKAAITASLYQESDALIEELLFVKDYIHDAGLNNNIVTKLIHDLRSHNIEGACDKIETLKQFIVANQAPIVEEGMAPEFPHKLEDHKASLAQKNKDQKITADSGVVLTGNNNSNYTDLYNDIVKISDKGKRVFKNTLFEDQYIISKILKSMRSGNHGKSGATSDPATPTA
jgi:hypothetical protein